MPLRVAVITFLYIPSPPGKVGSSVMSASSRIFMSRIFSCPAVVSGLLPVNAAIAYTTHACSANNLGEFSDDGGTSRGLFIRKSRASSKLYVVLGCARSTQPCTPLTSLNRVPALIGWGNGENVSSAGWHVTLCHPIWHVSSRRKLLYSVYLVYLRPGNVGN